MHQESSSAHPPPDCLTISSSSPGQLAISRQGIILLTLLNGQTFETTDNIFYSGPIGNFFKPGRKRFHEHVLSLLDTQRYDPSGPDEEFPAREYLSFWQRLLFRIRQLEHGGTVIVVPDDLRADDARLSDRIGIKYSGEFDTAWTLLGRKLELHRRYYDAYLPCSNLRETLISRPSREARSSVNNLLKSTLHCQILCGSWHRFQVSMGPSF